MKEIALIGENCQVYATVLGKLLERGNSVNAMVDYPERLMIENSQLTVSRVDFYHEEAMQKSMTGYDTVILAYDDNLTDHEHNNETLNHFSAAVTAARQAGVKKLIVVGGMQSEAFFVTLLNRIDDIDWKFISTEGDFATKTADEVK
ncbi:MAG: NAD(P)H-binding protein [Muribaculaceae bacterium]|nr:NAD(P)H-binding protein [Muribaculaceae bacterium]